MEEKNTSTKTETITTPEEKVDTQKEGKVVTVEEMQRRIAKEKERQELLSKEFDEYKQTENERINAALEQFKKEQEMTADEIAEYKAKEAERKHQEEIKKYEDKIRQFEEEKKINNIQKIAVEKLSEYEIKTDKNIINLVMDKDVETTVSKIDALKNLLQNERNKYIGTGVPNVSGGLGVEREANNSNVLDSHRLIK